MLKSVDYQPFALEYDKNYYVNCVDIIQESWKQGYLIPIESELFSNSILNSGTMPTQDCHGLSCQGPDQEGEGRGPSRSHAETINPLTNRASFFQNRFKAFLKFLTTHSVFTSVVRGTTPTVVRGTTLTL